MRLVGRVAGSPWERGRGGRGGSRTAGGRYRAVGAVQRHHQLRLVLVRLLRQLESLLNRGSLFSFPMAPVPGRDRSLFTFAYSWPN